MVLCVLSGAAFGHIMRHAQVKQRSMPWVGAWNYTLGAVASWLWLAFHADVHLGWEAAILGTLAGFTLVVSYFLMDYTIHAAGVGITQSVQWLGATVPIAGSIFIWREIPGALQTVGLLLAMVSLPLLAYGHSAPDITRSRWRVLFLAVLFLLEGWLGLSMKFYCKLTPEGSETAFLSFMFTGAAVGSAAAAFRASRPKLRDLAHGLAMGLSNLTCNFTFLRAMVLLPGTIVFPTTSAGSVVVTATIGMILWRERYHGRSLAGLVLAVISLVLINVKV